MGYGGRGLGTYICAHPLAGGGLTHIGTYSKKAIIRTNRNRATIYGGCSTGFALTALLGTYNWQAIYMK